MIPLSRLGAGYFCKSFSGQTTPTISMRYLYDTVLNRKKSFKEGDREYGQYRDTLLREADRSLFLGISCFRRGLDLFTASSVFWAHVSFYYSSWYAANCALGMFGCWVLGRRNKFRIVIEASQHIPGGQGFRVEKNYSSRYSGSHQIFWDAYYRAMKPIVLWTEASLQLAITPISSNPTWPIDRRNIINYQSIEAFKLINNYTANFNANRFPDSLQGDIVTQFKIAKTMLLFNAKRAKELGLKTDTYPQFASRAEAIKQLVYRAAPAKLSGFSEENNLSI